MALWYATPGWNHNVKRKLWAFENRSLRILVAPGGGHIAALHLKNGHPRAKSLPNPLWTPPWKSIEPGAYKAGKHDRVYGGAPEGRLLASILGHSLALDSFGTPSAAEIRAGGLTHGEAGVAIWKPAGKRRGSVSFSAKLPGAQLEVTREITFHAELPVARVRTVVRNLGRQDRPVAWAEHVSFGPPFLAPHTEFSLPARRAMVYPGEFGADAHLEPGREFVWPLAPLRNGGAATIGNQDMQFPPRGRRATSFTAQLFETPSDLAWFTATNPKLDLAVGYLFHRSDFPWVGIWDEKLSRATPPWNRRTFVRGLEFSTTPLPMSRREIISQGKLFGTPTFRWIEALGQIEAVFVLYVGRASASDLQDQALRFLNT
jgi:hypothetical protein